MSAAALLTELDAAGVRLDLAGDKLRFQTPPGVSIAPFQERIIAHKRALLAAVRQRQLDAEVADLEREWTWLESHSEDPAYGERETQWIERLRRYERVYRQLSPEPVNRDMDSGAPVAEESDASARAPRLADDETDIPAARIAQTVKNIVALTPEELQLLRAEIAAANADGPDAAFDQAALERFDAMTVVQAAIEDGGQQRGTLIRDGSASQSWTPREASLPRSATGVTNSSEPPGRSFSPRNPAVPCWRSAVLASPQIPTRWRHRRCGASASSRPCS